MLEQQTLNFNQCPNTCKVPMGTKRKKKGAVLADGTLLSFKRTK